MELTSLARYLPSQHVELEANDGCDKHDKRDYLCAAHYVEPKGTPPNENEISGQFVRTHLEAPKQHLSSSVTMQLSAKSLLESHMVSHYMTCQVAVLATWLFVQNP
jgi:hypothetical protein